MATKTITSEFSPTKVGKIDANTKPLYTATRVTYTLDENGKINQDTIKQEILYQQISGDPPVIAATRNGTSGDFTLNKNQITGKSYFGIDAQKSLKNGALKTTTQNQLDSASKKEGLTPEQRKVVTGKSNPTDLQAFNIGNPKEPNYQLSTKPGTRENFPTNLRYPEDMSSGQDKLKIDMIKFAPRTFGSPDKETGKLTSLTFGDRNIESSIGTVYLAIPGGISDNNKVNWGSQDMNAADAAVAAAALQIIQKGGDAIGAMGKQLKDVMTDAKLSKDITTGFAALFASQAAGVQGLLARTQGAVLNPNTELLFQGPALRAFTFNFKLSPRSQKEAKIVRSIIRFFKQGMAVQRTEKDLFLKAPHLFRLKFLKNDTDLNPFLPKTKLCALLDCSVDYTPESQYATFKDSSMVSYEMSLTFNELDPVFNDEYKNAENAEDTDIGY